MDKLVIPYSQCTHAEEAYLLVKKNIRGALSQWNINAEITYQDQSLHIDAKGTGFNMNITFQEKEAIAEVNLSFPLSALKQRIIPPLEKELKKYL